MKFSEIKDPKTRSVIIKLEIGQNNNSEGIVLENNQAPPFIMDIVVSGGKSNESISLKNLVIDSNENRWFSLPREIDVHDSIFYKMRIRVLGSNNVNLIARTIYNEQPDGKHYELRSCTSSFYGLGYEDSYSQQIRNVELIN